MLKGAVAGASPTGPWTDRRTGVQTPDHDERQPWRIPLDRPCLLPKAALNHLCFSAKVQNPGGGGGGWGVSHTRTRPGRPPPPGSEVTHHHQCGKRNTGPGGSRSPGVTHQWCTGCPAGVGHCQGKSHLSLAQMLSNQALTPCATHRKLMLMPPPPSPLPFHLEISSVAGFRGGSRATKEATMHAASRRHLIPGHATGRVCECVVHASTDRGRAGGRGGGGGLECKTRSIESHVVFLF